MSRLLQPSLAIRPQVPRELMMMGVRPRDLSRHHETGELIMVGVGPHDVLLGRSPKVYSAPGNQLFRKIINEHLEHYQKKATRSNKQYLALHIVSKIHELGGRFKRFCTSDGLWIEVSIEIAKEKVCHALRDARLNANRNGISGSFHHRNKAKSNVSRDVTCMSLVNSGPRLINCAEEKGIPQPDPKDQLFLPQWPKSNQPVSSCNANSRIVGCTPEELLDCQIETLLRLRSVILARAQQTTLLDSISLGSHGSPVSQVLLHPLQSEIDSRRPVQTVASMILPVVMNQLPKDYIRDGTTHNNRSCSVNVESPIRTTERLIRLEKAKVGRNSSQDLSVSALNDMTPLPVSPDNMSPKHHLVEGPTKLLSPSRTPKLVYRREKNDNIGDDDETKRSSVCSIPSPSSPQRRGDAIERKSRRRQMAPWHALVPKGRTSRQYDSRIATPTGSSGGNTPVPIPNQESREDGMDWFHEEDDFPRCDDPDDNTSLIHQERFPTEHTFQLLKRALDMCNDDQDHDENDNINDNNDES